MSNVNKMQIVLPRTIKKVVTSVSMALLTSSLLSTPVRANDKEWWFDVEVIIFTQDLAEKPVTETFEQSTLLPATHENIDLLTPYLTPDLSYIRAGLSFCRGSTLQAEQQKQAEGFAFVQPELGYEVEVSPETTTADGFASDDDLPVNQQRKANNESGQQKNSSDENFEYQVVTEDIFAEQSNISSGSTLQNTLQQKTAETAQQITNIPDVNKQKNLALEQVDVPLTINWVEWQIPKQFPCAYLEQITPSIKWLTQQPNEKKIEDPIAKINRVPIEISGIDWSSKAHGPYLLPQDQLHMTDLYNSIKKQRGISPLIHLAWRQQVTFGGENAKGYRLFAGENLASKFDINGQPKNENSSNVHTPIVDKDTDFYIPKEEIEKLTPSERDALLNILNPQTVNDETTTASLFAKIDQALAINTIQPIETAISDKPEQTKEIEGVKQLWNLDGFIKVYLQNVGRVPYLHINSQLDYRHPVIRSLKDTQTTNKPIDLSTTKLEKSAHQDLHLQSVNFEQLRRVISKQVHYFDHPMFGMIVTINRYNWPLEPEEISTDN